MPISPRTVLRILHRAPVDEGAAPTVIGIDDWAWRRGQAYGTIIVDLERHRPVDLLPDRAAASVAAWLAARPGTRIVSRDRGDNYAEAARRGAPQAMQVLDRWHLCRNLAQALERCLERQPGTLRAAADRRTLTAQPLTAPPDELPETPPNPTRPTTRAERESAERRATRLARYAEVCRLSADGVAMGAIARRLGISHKTVRRHLAAGHFRERAARPPSPTLLDPYRAYLDVRWASGCHNGLQLYREVGDRGYTGSRGAIARYAAQRRREEPVPPRPAAASRTQRSSVAPVRPPSVRQWVGLFLRRPAALTAEEQADLAALCLVDSGIAVAYACAQEFMRLVRARRGAEVARWFAQALGCGVPELVGFASGLQDEQAWVAAACTLPWSQGQTEGQVTRLKLIKRQGYGRSGFPLLRKRVLYAA
jgi:transposase